MTTLLNVLLVLVIVFALASMASTVFVACYCWRINQEINQDIAAMREATGRTLTRIDELKPLKPTYWGGKR